MKLTFVNIIIISLCQIINAQSFQGEIIYSVETKGSMSIDGKVYDASEEISKRGKLYDSLKVVILGNKYKKIRNTASKEEVYFDLEGKRSATIIEGEDKIFIDDLGYLNLIERECNSLGVIKRIEMSDTILSIYNTSCKHLLVEWDHGIEEFIFSDSLSTLNFDRNILRSEDCQIYTSDLSKEINRSILIYYRLTAMDVTTVFTLEHILPREVNPNEVAIPPHKEIREDKKINKYSERLKTYTLINEE